MGKSLTSIYVLFSVFVLIFFSQDTWSNAIPARTNISVYVFEGNNKRAESDATLFIKQKPALIMNEESIHEVNLIRRGRGEFGIEIELSPHVSGEIERITSTSIGKNLVFISDNRILFMPLILGPVQQGRLIIELPSMKKAEAENIARYFSSSFDFFDNHTCRKERLDPDLKEAYDLRDKCEYDKAIQLFEGVLKQKQDQNTKIVFLNEIAICQRLKGDRLSAAETYKKLIRERVDIDLNNYKVVVQAYFYLWRFEKEQQNIHLSENYFGKGIATLEYLIKCFPTVRSAESASLAIGTYELMRGNIKEAQKRAIIAKGGDFKGQGYLLLGLCYEYQKKLQKAKKEYESLINDCPNIAETRIAQDLIKRLDNGKTNIDKILQSFSL